MARWCMVRSGRAGHGGARNNMKKVETKLDGLDKSKAYQILTIGDRTWTSDDGALEFQPLMGGFRLGITNIEKKESTIAPQERFVMNELFFDADGKVVVEFTSCTGWKVLRPTL